jgi:hypothetical protein
MDRQLAIERTQKLFYKAEWALRSMAKPTDSRQFERVYHCPIAPGADLYDTVYRYNGTAYIEPKFGYIVTEHGTLIEDSMTTNLGIIAEPWKQGLPSPSEFRDATKKGSHRVIHHPKIISLRHLWEWNYYHFYVDILSRLRALDDAGIDKSIPLALGNYADDVAFVKQIIGIGSLASRNWVLPGHDFVSADEVYYCRTQQSWKARLSYPVSLMNLPRPNLSSRDRIFLVRPLAATRRILNQPEIEPVISKYGFRTVDTSQMSVKDQIDLFADARHLIAVHGAGMVNVIYRQGAPLSVLELRPDVYNVECMQDINKDYGYYTDILGGKSDSSEAQHANFTVDPATLEQKIVEMLDVS